MASRAGTMPYLPPQKRSHLQVAEWVSNELLMTHHMWVAEVGGHVVGYAALLEQTLEHLYILPDARRSGVGSRLLDTVKQHSQETVLLHVFQQNTDAIHFYQSHGFTVVSSSDGRDNMEHLPAFTMQWTKKV